MIHRIRKLLADYNASGKDISPVHNVYNVQFELTAQNLLMLMMRNVLTTVWCRFGRLSLVIKLSFCSDFEHKVSIFGQDFEVHVQAKFLKLKFGQYIAADAWLGL